MYFTYVLLSEKDGKHYTGYTKDLKLRFDQHQNGEVYYAFGLYEKEVHSISGTRELYYINTPTGHTAILESTSSGDELHFVHSDMLGSFDVITDETGTIEERLSFDPWGRRRSTSDWSYNSVPTTFLFDRGFTGHEHLDEFFLINMNGRVYDPLLAMFLSPDNFIQSPENTQNLNRYAYCLNNPLIYTDPDGEFWQWVIPTVIQGIQNYQAGVEDGMSSRRALLYAGINMLGDIASNMLNVPGIIPNAAIQAGSSVLVNGLTNDWVFDKPFFDNWAPNALLSGISGGVAGYSLSNSGGLNNWWGSEIGYNRGEWSINNSHKPDYIIETGIPNVGSKMENDCVPTTQFEAEVYRKGERTYNVFIETSGYIDGVGVRTSPSGYISLMQRTFENVDVLGEQEASKLFDPDYFNEIVSNREVISFHFGGKTSHADNVRKLKVFVHAPGLNQLVFRKEIFNLRRYNFYNGIWRHPNIWSILLIQ